MSAILPIKITIGDLYGPAMKVVTSEEAQAYFTRLIERAKYQQPELSDEEAFERERANLCYYAGYYDPADRIRVLDLYFTK